MIKITIIGGGSYSWGPTFLRDIFITPELRGATIVLHDIISERVDLVYALAQKVMIAFRLDFHLEKTLSLDDALQGADFVILTITHPPVAWNPCALTWRFPPNMALYRR